MLVLEAARGREDVWDCLCMLSFCVDFFAVGLFLLSSKVVRFLLLYAAAFLEGVWDWPYCSAFVLGFFQLSS